MIVPSDEDIIFESIDDLLNSSKSKIVIYKYQETKLPITHGRNFLSYCLEFCGVTGLSHNSLRYQLFGRDVKFDTVIS